MGNRESIDRVCEVLIFIIYNTFGYSYLYVYKGLVYFKNDIVIGVLYLKLAPKEISYINLDEKEVYKQEDHL